MAAGEAAEGEDGTAKEAVGFDGEGGVFGAGGLEAAGAG